MANIIQKSILARSERLIASIEEAKSFSHPTERGSLYEAYIRTFLEDTAPQQCEIHSGFVTDAKGNISPQLDLIVLDPSALPPIKLDSQSVICPVEALRFFIEVKATIEYDTLKQVKKQLESIQKMELHYVHPKVVMSFKPSINFPAFLVGYKSLVPALSRSFFGENIRFLKN